MVKVHGTLVSDNGPCFTSREFSDFANEWGFNQTFSCPKQPDQNGLAERGVQTVNNFLKKKSRCRRCVTCVQFDSIAKWSRPAQLFFNREVRTKVPRIIRKLDDEEQQ
uniref:Putative LOC101484488 [Maylandia zebra] n=1 Tax=Lepeophtheirus salmonis TaxID=72036 RepID=A0A0K2TGA7_LEPSM